MLFIPFALKLRAYYFTGITSIKKIHSYNRQIVLYLCAK